MSTITLELPDDIAARVTTPEGMARAQAAVMAAFAEDTDEAFDTRTPREKAIDAVRETRKAHERKKREDLVAAVRGENLP